MSALQVSAATRTDMRLCGMEGGTVYHYNMGRDRPNTPYTVCGRTLNTDDSNTWSYGMAVLFIIHARMRQEGCEPICYDVVGCCMWLCADTGIYGTRYGTPSQTTGVCILQEYITLSPAQNPLTVYQTPPVARNGDQHGRPVIRWKTGQLYQSVWK